MISKKKFLEKYPCPKECPIPEDEWSTSLGYCWGYARTIDEKKDIKKWVKKHCPCKFFTDMGIKHGK